MPHLSYTTTHKTTHRQKHTTNEQSTGKDAVYLHLRLRDAEASALYRGAGFEEVAKDGWWLKLLGMDRRFLMRCTTAPPASD